ncbi:MAG: hypothetical protein VKL39_17270 [Leptolyngbyaceae bacterium]|nr:hypothetical protein [Leptolyngbyaceae bacterium]
MNLPNVRSLPIDSIPVDSLPHDWLSIDWLSIESLSEWLRNRAEIWAIAPTTVSIEKDIGFLQIPIPYYCIKV